MAKLYFKYGTMGSSKSAQALMCKYNYEERGFRVLLIKSQVDKRDIENKKIVVKSRIGLSSPCETFTTETDLFEFIKNRNYLSHRCVVVVDEVQFVTKQQVEQLKHASRYIPVICYGLLTNFKTELFEGSKRLVEIADSLHEIKTICKCGKKANINARLHNGQLVTDGEEIKIGGNDCYQAMCFNCYKKMERNQIFQKKNTQ